MCCTKNRKIDSIKLDDVNRQRGLTSFPHIKLICLPNINVYLLGADIGLLLNICRLDDGTSHRL